MSLFGGWKYWKFLRTLALWLLKNKPDITELSQLKIDKINVNGPRGLYDYHAHLLIKEKNSPLEGGLEVWHIDTCEWTTDPPYQQKSS